MVIEHIIAGHSIAHNKGAIPLTKESYDIKEPQKKLSDYSKTITIPESDIVNQIFEHAFDVNVLFQTFDPNLKTSYRIIQDGITLIDGYCRLVDIVNTDGKVEYKIQGIGKIGSVFETIKDLYLEDIDFTDLDHTWTESNIVASWTPTLGTAYVYPMIDYGGRTSYDNWKVEDFKPAIFVREYMNRIFNAQGFTISSAFFDTTLFKSLVVPYAADQPLLINNGLKAKQFYVSRVASDYTVQNDGILIFNDDNPTNYNTALNEYDISTGIFTAQEVNNYAWNGVLDMTLTYTSSNSLEIARMNSTRLSSDFSCWFEVELIKKTGGTTSVVDNFIFDITDTAKTTNVTTNFSMDVRLPFSMDTFETEVGSEYYLLLVDIVTYNTNFWQQAPTMAFDLNTTSALTQKIKDTYFTKGDTLIMDSLTPNQVKQSDFVGSIIKRFNLYLDYDAIDANLIYIEPREDYYNNVKVDVSEKVDRSKELVISPLGALDASTYLFEDKKDSDVKNKLHQDTTEEIYGRYKVDIANDFIKNERKITTIFSPTPLVSEETKNDRVISSIAFEDSNRNKTDAKGNIRLLYWGGLKATDKVWNLETSSKSSYPYAGHLDNPYAPTFDLNWGVPRKLFYDFSYGGSDVVVYPNANCYNTFWKNYIEEITSKDSKLLTCYVSLRPADYADYNFRQSYYIDGEYWRLIKIVDYSPTSYTSTKCIFLKQYSPAPFVGTYKEVLGGGGVFDTGEELPAFFGTSRPNQSGGATTDVITFGDNVTSGFRSIIVSDNITGVTSNKNLLLMASDNSRIQASNVTLLNSPNTDVVRNNEVYINGLFTESRVDITLDETILEGLSGGQEILPALRADEAYEILRGYVRINGVAPSVGDEVIIKSASSSLIVANIPAAFFTVDNNTGFVEIVSVPSILFGEAISISSTDFESPAATEVKIQLIYRIIKI